MQRRREFSLPTAPRRSPAVFLATATAFAVHACALQVVMSSPPAAGGSSPGAASATTAPSISTTAGAASSVSSSDSAAKGVIDGFAPREYSAPWWAKNDHFSTIFGSGEIQKRFGVKGPEVVYRRERWNTPDGDFLDVDFLDTPGGAAGGGLGGSGTQGVEQERRQGASPPGGGRRLAAVATGAAPRGVVNGGGGGGEGGTAATVPAGDPAVGFESAVGTGGVDASTAPFAVLTHGLESTSTAPLTAKMALAYQRKGFRVAVMCFRSCSGEDNLTLRAYHLGFTEDLELVCKTLRASRHPNSPLFLSGFSLGRNVITKFLGELGDRARDMGIMGGAVTCVPFDAVSCQQRVDTGFGKIVYAKNFLNSLIPKMMRKSLTDPRVAEVIDLKRLQRITAIGEFDDMVIAPVFGFDDYQDYYRKTQSGQFLKGVRVPFLAVQAINDPFMDPAKLPTVDDLQGAPVRLSYHEHGGHCAFLTDSQEENDKGWLATEMARFGDHVHRLSRTEPPTAD
ncbi:unnamed protein product [Ectocarpus sp. 6 AP-2014]